MVNSEALQSAHLQGRNNRIALCKSLPWRDATSQGQRCCLTSELHIATPTPVHNMSQEPPPSLWPPHPSRLVSLHQKQGNHSQTVHGEWPPAHQNTHWHWQGPNPCQRLCKHLNRPGDLMPLLKAPCPCLIVRNIDPALETHLTKSLLSRHWCSCLVFFSFCLLHSLRNGTFSA